MPANPDPDEDWHCNFRGKSSATVKRDQVNPKNQRLSTPIGPDGDSSANTVSE